MGISDDALNTRKKYCTKCGSVLHMEGDWGYCNRCMLKFHIPQDKQLVNQQKKFCTKCGNVLRIDNGWGYCDNCMLKFHLSQNPPAKIPVSTSHTNIVPTNLPIKNSNVNGVRGKRIVFPDWYVSISFAKSKSENYPMAVALAKAAPQYHEQYDNQRVLHQAIYSSKPNEYLAFVRLYELVGNWKSSFVFINGNMIDRKIIAKLNYCYGDNCRSGNPNFCFGASYMTDNPFGCHRFQISACNSPWWSFYVMQGRGKWVLDKQSIKKQIDSYANVYNICPLFDYNYAIAVLNALPNVVSDYQLQQIKEGYYRLKF